LGLPKEQPPLIPHKVDGFDEITATENACLDCHSHTEITGQKIPRAEKSHFVKPVSASAAQVLDMQRWQCNSTSAPDAAGVRRRPLRPSNHRPAIASRAEMECAIFKTPS
jgi:nitrate reductase cytochrome c-type subunit